MLELMLFVGLIDSVHSVHKSDSPSNTASCDSSQTSSKFSTTKKDSEPQQLKYSMEQVELVKK